MQHALIVLALLPLACGQPATAAPARPAPSKPADPPSKPADPPAPSKPADPPAPSKPADPPPSKPAPDAACRPAGGVLFEIDHRVDAGAKLPASTTKVFANGGWTREDTDSDGKAASARAGCLDKPALKQLETTLQGAPWKVTMARMRCMAISASYTVYQVRGKPVFTQRLCSGESLDDKSRAKLDAAVQLVEGAAGKPAP
jgi:hypothetical protein